MSLTVRIITPETSMPELPADHVTMPAWDGEVGIRPGHAPFVCELGRGRLEVRHSTLPDGNERFVIQGGVAQVQDDELRILAESAAKSQEISEAKLAERLRELDAGTYETDAEKLEAQAEVHWIVTQLRSEGMDVPELQQF